LVANSLANDSVAARPRTIGVKNLLPHTGCLGLGNYFDPNEAAAEVYWEPIFL
jgi:hypothetical protein